MDALLLRARIAALDSAARSLAAEAHTIKGLLDRAAVFEEWLLRDDVSVAPGDLED